MIVIAVPWIAFGNSTIRHSTPTLANSIDFVDRYHTFSIRLNDIQADHEYNLCLAYHEANVGYDHQS